ncbi:MAG: cobalamin-dependent protein, partial [bacterium]
MKWVFILPATPFRKGHIYGYVRAAVLPLGLAMLGAMLEQEGHRACVCDCQIPHHDLDFLKRLLGPADAVGVSVTTLTAQDAYSVMNAVRSARPQVPIIIGGPHPTALGENVMRECCADVAVFHEGEQTILNLARALMQGDGLDGVKGIAFRREGAIVRTDPQPFIEDLDTLPFPARHLFPVTTY